ncbi:MAG: alpha/beta hydrolase [Clostridia bacterium]|nr:alpha/beta hydrolase [Clostridia bacterium]
MIEQWLFSTEELHPDFRRRVYICTPPSYSTNPDTYYPVLYLFDGQNLFYDRDASFGKSWNLAEYVEKSDPECILVGIESNPFGNERLSEYSPFTHNTPELGYIHGTARTTISWLLNELKPAIDESFRSMPDRDHTFIGGSSMGGLISLFGITAYNSEFSRALCLSPSLWVNPDKVRQMISNSKIEPHTLVYMDYGSEEMSNHAATFDALLECTRLLLNRDVDLTFRIEPYGDHSEASWEKRVPIFMRCLGLA